MNKERTKNILLILSFGIFGLTALIFQIVFAKNLIFLFGLTAPAIATALAVYFSGIALGSFIFGKLADRQTRTSTDRTRLPAGRQGQTRTEKLYVLTFLATGIYGCLFPLLFKILNKIILLINQVHPLNFSGFNFFVFVLSFLFLILPAIFIGGSFPVISKIILHNGTQTNADRGADLRGQDRERTDAEEEAGFGKKISLIYFVNTFGSVVGALAAGFWLIPFFGTRATIFFAAILNLVVGVIIFSKSKNIFEKEKTEFADEEKKIAENQTQEIGLFKNKIFLYALFLTGFLALAMEVFYTKTLILFIGSSTYAFSLILIIFLLGIALGSWVMAYLADRLRQGFAYFGIFSGLIGFWLFLTVKFFQDLPFWYLRIFGALKSFDFPAILTAQFILAFLVIFPVTFLMGLMFPLGLKLAAPDFKKISQGVGKLYFANTLGGVLGSLMAGFFLLPTLGFQKTLLFILTLYLLLGVFFVFKEKLLEMSIKSVLAAFLVFWGAFAIISHPWSPNILASGVFPYAPEYLRFGVELGEAGLKKGMASDTVLFYKEGLSQIAVIGRGNTIFLRINGKTDASNTMGDLEHQILTGALPLMLHPEPKDILMIGLGSGISLGSVTQFDEPENIEMVEIDPAVVEAAKYFKDYNNNALADLRVKIIVADGRNYLYLTDKKYDVISSQPSNLWVSGNAYLFTKEYYQLAKKHLKENGLMYQWVQIYGFQPEDLKSILKTFSEVFPNVYLFSNINDTDIFLIGALNDRAILDFNEIAKKFEIKKIQQELSRIHIYDAYEFLSYFITSDKEIKRFISEAEVHTDNRPFLEFSAPKTFYQLVSEIFSGNLLKLREKFFSNFYTQNESQEIIKNLGPEDKEKLKNYLIFRQKIVPVIVALRDGDLDKALELYNEVLKTGIFNTVFWNRMNNACQLKAEMAFAEQGKEAAEKIRQKCEIIFSETEAP